MENFNRTAKLKEFYGKQPYTYHQVLTINILLSVLPTLCSAIYYIVSHIPSQCFSICFTK